MTAASKTSTKQQSCLALISPPLTSVLLTQETFLILGMDLGMVKRRRSQRQHPPLLSPDLPSWIPHTLLLLLPLTLLLTFPLVFDSSSFTST